MEPAVLFIEAEHFDHFGGWVLDTQFIHTMGSPYLLAHGLGKPVDNATTSITVPKTGTYTVWVRTKNWAPGDWAAPGRFKIIIGNEEVPTEFGTEPGWNWQKGASVDLSAGQVSLELKDLTGFEGRCDAILLVDDPDYAPDNSSVPMNAWRRRLLGLSDDIVVQEYDLVVVGGGLAGIGSAIAAARLGLKVALVHNRPVLGGNGSSEVTVPPEGKNPGWLYPLSDIIDEVCVDVRPVHIGLPELYGDKKKEAVIRDEPNIDLFLNHHAFDLSTSGNRIDTIDALCSEENIIRRFRGKLVVDNTGHGYIGYWAGADHVMEAGDRMGMTNLWRWRTTDSPQTFPETPWALQLEETMFPYPINHNGITPIGTWYWESGFNKHPMDDLEEIRDHNFRAIYGAWNAIKNKGAYSGRNDQEHATAELEWLAYIGGTRETLQVLGDVVLTKADILGGRVFEDRCVITTWGLDLHYPHPLYRGYFSDNPFISRAHFGDKIDDSTGELATSEEFFVHSQGGHLDRDVGYAIPYRCLYSRSIENLFVPGRNMSVTHEALGTVRVMRTLGMCGVAVGRAAYLANLNNTTPRGVYENHLDELKELWSKPGEYRLSS